MPKVDIIYRCCPKETEGEMRRSIRPHWYSKFSCFKSVWDMTVYDPTTFRIHIIYDGEDSMLLDYIKPMPMAHDGLRRVNRGNYDSIYDAYDYADTLDGDWIYFVEDDYLHTADAARVFMEGAIRFPIISLYDHLDRYTRTDDITDGQESLALTPSCHWRTAESTCHTWATTRETWKKIKALARLRGPSDRHFFQQLVGEGIRLWTPIPGRSTHCYKGYMSPGVDWEQVAANVKL